MKKYNVFSLSVITIDRQKFICESIIPGEKYREILTGRKIDLKEKYIVEKLSEYYCLLGIMNYKTKEPLMLSKESILYKYIEINQPKEEPYYQEQTQLSSLISKTIENTDEFYRKIGEEITCQEKQYIKSLLDKNCNTCTNDCCKEKYIDNTTYDCIDWENDRIVGEYKVLKLNRKTKEI